MKITLKAVRTVRVCVCVNELTQEKKVEKEMKRPNSISVETSLLMNTCTMYVDVNASRSFRVKHSKHWFAKKVI